MESRRRAELDVRELASRFPPKGPFRAIFAKPSDQWSLKEVGKVGDYLALPGAQGFRVLLAYTRAFLALAPKEVGLAGRGSDELRAALNDEAVQTLTLFLEKSLSMVVRTYVPGQDGAFLAHALAHLRDFLGGGLPPELRMLSKPSGARTGSQLRRAERWIAENWRERLCALGLCHGAGRTGSVSAEDIVQEFFEERPSKIRRGGDEQGMIVPKVRGVLKSYDHTRKRFWRYLRFCFLRYCWYRIKQLEQEQQLEPASSNLIESASDSGEYGLLSPSSLIPDQAVATKEWLELFNREVRRFIREIPGQVPRWVFRKGVLQAQGYKQVWEWLNKKTNHNWSRELVGVTICRLRHQLRKDPRVSKLLSELYDGP